MYVCMYYYQALLSLIQQTKTTKYSLYMHSIIQYTVYMYCIYKSAKACILDISVIFRYCVQNSTVEVLFLFFYEG